METQHHYQLIADALHWLCQNQQNQPSLEELAQHVDLSPHYLQRVFQDWAGVSPKQFLKYLTKTQAMERLRQGRSVLEWWEGRTDSPYAGADQVGYELFGLKAFFTGDWKILWMPPPFGKGEWELFNVAMDPGELNDLGGEHPGRVEEMVDLWEQYEEDNGVLDISFDLFGEVESAGE